MNRLKTLLKLLLMLAAGLASFSLAMQWRRPAAGDQLAIVEPMQRSERMATAGLPSSASVPSERDRLLPLSDRSRPVPQTEGDAFATLSWLPIPAAPRASASAPPPPPPTQPAAPVAPALPFTFVGLIEQSGVRPQAFLTKADALLVVAAGDLIDNNTYRIESLTPQQMVLTYLPLNTPQTLDLSGSPK